MVTALFPFGPGRPYSSSLVDCERAVSNLACATVPADDHVGGRGGAVDQLEAGGDRSRLEEPLATAKQDGEVHRRSSSIQSCSITGTQEPGAISERVLSG
jgi:hypothetical protein